MAPQPSPEGWQRGPVTGVPPPLMAAALAARTVGRVAIPTNTIGLLCHAAEHAMRHLGQAFVTAKVVRSRDRVENVDHG